MFAARASSAFPRARSCSREPASAAAAAAAARISERAAGSLSRRARQGLAPHHPAAAVRCYASVAGPAGVAVGTAGDHVKLVSVDDPTSDACVLSFVLPAGPRHERVGEPGLAHCRKTWAFQGTFTNTALAIAREAEIHGGSLSSNLSREALFLTAEFHRKDFKFFLELLRDAVYLTQYNPHEAELVNKLVSDETNHAYGDPDVVLNESLHSAAFRAGLGNSLYAHPRDVTPDDVADFDIRSRAKPVLAAVGVSSSELHPVAQGLLGDDFKSLRAWLQKGANPALLSRFQTSPAAAEKPGPAKYFGGERRIDAATDDCHLAVAYPTGGALGSQVAAVAQVLKAHLGGHAATSYGSGTSPLARVGAKAGAGVQAFAYGYSDAGLLGVRVRSSNECAGDVVKAAVAEIKRAADGIPPEELKAAVARAKVTMARAFESKASLAEYLGSLALCGSEPAGVRDVFSKLDAVKPEDVSKLARAMLKSKPSFVVYGNTLALPYADSL